MVFGTGPWLRDREGNDVFDGFGDTTIVDRISVEESVSGTPFDFLSGTGRTIDTLDDTLHGVGGTMAPGFVADAGVDFVEDAAEVGQLWQEDGYPTDPSNRESGGGIRLLLYVALVGGALWLIRPFVDLGAELAE